MLLRYFAQTDESEVGIFALTWAHALDQFNVGELPMRGFAVKTPLRIAATEVANIQQDRRGHNPSSWTLLQHRFATELEDDYVNILCSRANDWAKFFTARKRNVLIAAPHQVITPNMAAAALLYQVVIVANDDDLALMQHHGVDEKRLHKISLPIPIADAPAFVERMAPILLGIE